MSKPKFSVSFSAKRQMFFGAMAVALSAFLMFAACANPGDTGSFTDSRDGKKYRTVEIGGKTWMAENLNFKTDSSWCYGDADSNCVKYGRLYIWRAAKAACSAMGAGWRLPTREDWYNLEAAAAPEATVGYDAGTNLKSRTGWRNGSDYTPGIDKFGFSAMPGGERSNPRDNDYIPGTFSLAGIAGYWWSATLCGISWDADGDMSSSSFCVWSWSMWSDRDDVFPFRSREESGYSARCLRD